jgi:hypothetical protein
MIWLPDVSVRVDGVETVWDVPVVHWNVQGAVQSTPSTVIGSPVGAAVTVCCCIALWPTI